MVILFMYRELSVDNGCSYHHDVNSHHTQHPSSLTEPNTHTNAHLLVLNFSSDTFHCILLFSVSARCDRPFVYLTATVKWGALRTQQIELTLILTSCTNRNRMALANNGISTVSFFCIKRKCENASLIRSSHDERVSFDMDYYYSAWISLNIIRHHNCQRKKCANVRNKVELVESVRNCQKPRIKNKQKTPKNQRNEFGMPKHNGNKSENNTRKKESSP